MKKFLNRLSIVIKINLKEKFVPHKTRLAIPERSSNKNIYAIKKKNYCSYIPYHGSLVNFEIGE